VNRYARARDMPGGKLFCMGMTRDRRQAPKQMMTIGIRTHTSISTHEWSCGPESLLAVLLFFLHEHSLLSVLVLGHLLPSHP
jgi:hypothetical protein